MPAEGRHTALNSKPITRWQLSRKQRLLDLSSNVQLGFLAGQFESACFQLQLEPIEHHSQHCRRSRAAKGQAPGEQNRCSRQHTPPQQQKYPGSNQEADHIELVSHPYS